MWLKKLNECQEEYKKVAVKVTASSPLTNPPDSQEIDETNNTTPNCEILARTATHPTFSRRHHHRRMYCNHRRKSYDRICSKNIRRWQRKLSRVDSEVTDGSSFDEYTDQPGDFESDLGYENDDCSPANEYANNDIEQYKRNDILTNCIKEVDGDYKDNEKAQLDETGPQSEVQITYETNVLPMAETVFI